MAVEVLPLAVVIPTRNRAISLRRTFHSLARQSSQPSHLIVVDASEDGLTRSLCESEGIQGLKSVICWYSAEIAGAAAQRNQGIRTCSTTAIGFFDDDILFDPDCIARLWMAMESDQRLGGVNAMISNQRYQTPGRISQLVFRLMAGTSEPSYAGRVLGPAVNLLPEDRDDLPELVPVEWLNTTCTLYRRKALPDPPFPDQFKGYSLMEDLALSLTVGKKWKLANARNARIFHDSQPGSHKSDPADLAEMGLINRLYVMKRILGRNRVRDYLKLILWLAFSHLASLAHASAGTLASRIRGEFRAIGVILKEGLGRP